MCLLLIVALLNSPSVHLKQTSVENESYSLGLNIEIYTKFKSL